MFFIRASHIDIKLELACKQITLNFLKIVDIINKYFPLNQHLLLSIQQFNIKNEQTVGKKEQNREIKQNLSFKKK